MTSALVTLDDGALLNLVSDGDCSKLSKTQRIQYYKYRCETAGLDPGTQPFQFIKMDGKLVLYAVKECAAQLSKIHGIRCSIVDKGEVLGVYQVTVKAICADGRETEDMGAVSVDGIKNKVLANALMKCVTKAKRRAILSVCGLGMLDESEIESVPGAKVVDMPEIKEAVKPKEEKKGDLTEAHQEKIKGWMKEHNLTRENMLLIAQDLCGEHVHKGMNQADFAKLSEHFSKLEEQK